MRVLNVAEKNAAASTIAYLLSKGQLRKSDSYSKFNKLFEFQINLFGQQCLMIMTSVSGHLMSQEFGQGYNKWGQCPPITLFEAPIEKSVSTNMTGIKRTLEQEAKRAQKLIIWTDCDREGENIGYEVIDLCKKVNGRLDIYRAKFSEMTPAAINRAVNNLGRPDPKVSKAVDVRSELDLRTGAAFTRFQTLRLSRLFPRVLENMLISYGSCQFPTLGFVVDRYKQMKEFVIEDFWKIKMSHSVGNQVADFNWARVRLFDEQACRSILQLLQEDSIATVTSVMSKPKSKWRPQAMDTVEMEKLAVRKLRMTAKKAMATAEALYTRGIISYPRTETNIFPRELNLNNLIQQHANHPTWGEFASRLLDEDGAHPRNGHKTDNAHPPIHPTKCVGPNELQNEEAKLYELIARHFLACCSSDAQGKEYVVEVDIKGELFSASGLTILALNYLEVYPYEKWSERTVPEYQQGQRFEPTVLDIAAGQTAPPPLLSEADLIALMEKHGIGTDATHAEHIDTIQKRLYVGVKHDGRFTPGELGMGLVEGYDAMGMCMSKPNLRAEFESDLCKICNGTADAEAVLKTYIAKYREIFQNTIQQAKKLDESLGQYFGAPQPGNENDGGFGWGGGGDGGDGGDGGGGHGRGGGGGMAFESMQGSLKLSSCPSCNADVLLKTRKSGGYFFGCLGYPNCRVSVFLPDTVQNVKILDDKCQKCSIHPHLVEISFRSGQVPFGLDNPHRCCLGGCDLGVCELIGTRALLRSSRMASTNTGGSGSNSAFGSSSTVNTQSTTSTALTVVQPQQTNTALSTTVSNWQSQQQQWSSNGGGAVSQSLPKRSASAGRQSGGDDNVLCTCNLPAVRLTVKKPGPNQGRLFLKCASGECEFFLWDDNSPACDNDSGRQRQVSNQNHNCSSCGRSAIRLVAKQGQNAGKAFWACPRPGDGGCGKWLCWDEVGSDGPQYNAGENTAGRGYGGRGRSSDFQGRGNQPPANRPGFLGGGQPIGAGRGRGAGGGRGGAKRSYGGGSGGTPTASKQRKCGVCGQPGHNRKNCPNQ